MNQIRFGGIPYLHLDVYQGHDHVFNIQVEDDSTKEIIRYQEGTLTCKVRRNSPQGGVVLTLTPKFNNDMNCVDLLFNSECTSTIVFSYDNIKEETFYYDIRLDHEDKDEVVCYGEVLLKAGCSQ
mgnify:FL=1